MTYRKNSSSSNQNIVHISAKKVGIDLELTIVLLAFLSLAGQSLKYLTVYDEAFGLIPLVYMGNSLSIPTIFAVLLVLGCALLLAFISREKIRQKDKFRNHWVGLTTVFFYLSLDKGSGLHRYLVKSIYAWLHTGLLSLSFPKWLITFSLVGIILFCFYSKFILHLPARIKKIALFSLLIYYAGFCILQRVNVDYAGIYGYDNLPYCILTTLGKFLELSGINAVLYGLLDYIENFFPERSLNS